MPNFRFILQAVALPLLPLAVIPLQQVLAASGPTLPIGGTFVWGSGTIANSANAVTINQASNRGIVDWTNFSIGNSGRVLFLNGAGATLNRVTGNQMSLRVWSFSPTRKRCKRTELPRAVLSLPVLICSIGSLSRNLWSHSLASR